MSPAVTHQDEWVVKYTPGSLPAHLEFSTIRQDAEECCQNQERVAKWPLDPNTERLFPIRAGLRGFLRTLLAQQSHAIVSHLPWQNLHSSEGDRTF